MGHLSAAESFEWSRTEIRFQRVEGPRFGEMRNQDFNLSISRKLNHFFDHSAYHEDDIGDIAFVNKPKSL
jgi:hypothetical protein